MNEKENKVSPEAAPPTEAERSRRKFLELLSIILAGIGTLILAVPLVSFIVAPLFRKTPQVWRPVGKADGFKIGQTTAVTFQDASPLPWAGVTANTAAWLRRESLEEFIAFAINCTHLGCPVRWLASANLFIIKTGPSRPGHRRVR
jgi:menaquinol-cytochrome c reductase iron-sulfur subunit